MKLSKSELSDPDNYEKLDSSDEENSQIFITISRKTTRQTETRNHSNVKRARNFLRKDCQKPIWLSIFNE